MRNLFLASYFTEVSSMLPSFVEGDCVGKKVVVIPTAALHEEVAFYVDTDRSALQSLGFIVEDLEISNATYEVIEKSLSTADFIFVGGGNTFFLLQELKRTGADQLIVDHINNGKLYISTSAGSIILSKDIGFAKDTDSPDIALGLNGDFLGLSVIDFYVFPHYGSIGFEESNRQTLNKYSGKLDFKLMQDNQAVIVKGNTVEIITV